MNEPKSNDGTIPGRYARVEFVDYRTIGGQIRETRTAGRAFIPEPLPESGAVPLDSGRLLESLGEAMAALGRLDGFVSQLDPEVRIDPWLLYRPLRAREARLSSKIENTIAEPRELAMAAVVRSDRDEVREVHNYLRASDLGHAQPGPITEALIRELHRVLIGDLPDAHRKLPGRYRDRLVYLGDESEGFSGARFVPPPPSEIGPLMQSLVRFVNEPPRAMPELVSIGLAHYQFETIHPFADGNGRLGRMLIELLLVRRGLLRVPVVYPSAYIERHRQTYYERLRAVSTNGDWTGWVAFFLEAVRTQAADAQERVRALFDLRREFLARAQDRSLGDRFVRAVDCLFENPAVTAASLSERIGGSHQTARNYIEIFLENGTLVEVTGKGRNKVYLAPEVIAVANDDPS